MNTNGTKDESCSKEVGVAWAPFYLECPVVCRRELLCGYGIVVAPSIRSTHLLWCTSVAKIPNHDDWGHVILRGGDKLCSLHDVISRNI